MPFLALDQMDLIRLERAYIQRGETLVKHRFHTCDAQTKDPMCILGFLTRDSIAACLVIWFEYASCSSSTFGACMILAAWTDITQ